MAKTPVGVIKAIDEVYRLRNEIKLLEAAEKELADTVKRYMLDNDLDSIDAKKAQAVMTVREVREIDPEAYFDAIDGDTDKLLSSVKVRIEGNKKKDLAGADTYLGQEELNSLCSVTEVASLSVKRIQTQARPSPVSVPQRKVAVA